MFARGTHRANTAAKTVAELMDNKGKKGPSGAEKRRLYLIAFCVAFGIDLLLSIFRGGGYQPTLIGLAIMIAAVLYFAYSWITDR